MKKLILPLTIAAVMAFGCKTEKPTEITILADGTPYSSYPEIMKGKVKTVVEKNYGAVPDGESYKKGNPLTRADRDSLGNWTDDFEAVYDENGVIVVCTGLDETGNPVWKNESVIENKLVSQMNLFRKDTLRYIDQFKHSDNGFLISGTHNRAKVDTLIRYFTIKTNAVGYPTEFQTFNPKGEPTEKYTQTYDEQNRFVKFEAYKKDGSINFIQEVKYNEKSKVSELIFKDKDNKITASNYFTYEYDEKGNWIKAVVKDDKNHVVIEERSYTYFE
jgi:hypothetical protein